jgi:U4/U6 small nuclear ribonucleoprotein PRP3
MEGLPLATQDSVITIYVQHPIPIPAPGDKNKAALKPLMLTTKVCALSTKPYTR